jgi:hypothetical protein
MSPTQDEVEPPSPLLPGSSGPKKLSSPSDMEQSVRLSVALSSGESVGTQMLYLNMLKHMLFTSVIIRNKSFM